MLPQPNILALYLAMAGTLCFATASLVFADYARKVSVLWMNCFKALVSFIALVITIPIFTWWHPIAPMAVGGFLLSGLIGLNIGDLFLLSAFTRLGAARTLILFGFQPLFVGVSAYFLFGQPMNPARLLAVLFLIGCLFCFSWERYRREKRWEWVGLLFALIGVAMDTTGILLTKASFAISPSIEPIEGHFWRCLGALIGFFVMGFYRPIRLKAGFTQWSPKIRLIIIGASLGGAYLSILFYLSALKIGHLASISAIAITGPMFATLLECIAHRKAPSPYLAAAFTFFCAGFYILLTT